MTNFLVDSCTYIDRLIRLGLSALCSWLLPLNRPDSEACTARDQPFALPLWELLITEADGITTRRPRSTPRCISTSTRRRLTMPQVRPKSEHKHPSRKSRRASSRTIEAPVTQPPAKPPKPGGSLVSGAALRRHALSQLTQIQINTAGLSGPYRSDAETMEKVCANHAAVRQVRIILRRAIVVARRGPLLDALIAQALRVCEGNLAQAARSLGMTTRQLRRVLDAEGHKDGSAERPHRRCADTARLPDPSS